MSNVGGCDHCGRRFRRHDFRCDEEEDIRAYNERQAREALMSITPATKFCRRCERPFEPASPVQLRCRLCIPIYNRERDRRRIAAARRAS